MMWLFSAEDLLNLDVILLPELSSPRYKSKPGPQLHIDNNVIYNTII